MRIVFYISVMCCSLFAQGQSAFSNISVSKDTVEIGSSIDVTVSIRQLPSNGEVVIDFSKMTNLVYDQDTAALEQKGDFEVTNAGMLNKYLSNNKIAIPTEEIQGSLPIEERLSVSVFSIGVFELKAPFVVNPQDTIYSTLNSILFVTPPEWFGQDSTSTIKDIKPIIEIETTWQDYLPYLYSILGLLILSLITWYIFRRWKARTIETIQEEDVIEPQKIIPAHIIALNGLSLLEQTKPWEKGEVKSYQTELTGIIRTYIKNRYKVDAPEMTTGELIKATTQLGLSTTLKDNLTQILTIADLVKFAKARPEGNIHQEFLDKAFHFVNQTKMEVADE